MDDLPLHRGRTLRVKMPTQWMFRLLRILGLPWKTVQALVSILASSVSGLLQESKWSGTMPVSFWVAYQDEFLPLFL